MPSGLSEIEELMQSIKNKNMTVVQWLFIEIITYCGFIASTVFTITLSRFTSSSTFAKAFRVDQTANGINDFLEKRKELFYFIQSTGTMIIVSCIVLAMDYNAYCNKSSVFSEIAIVIAFFSV